MSRYKVVRASVKVNEGETREWKLEELLNSIKPKSVTPIVIKDEVFLILEQ